MIRLVVYRLIEFGRKVYQVLVDCLCTSNTELCRPTGLHHFLDSIVYGERSGHIVKSPSNNESPDVKRDLY
jgi:hypothetical protein